MTLDSELLSILACPSDDHAPLRETSGGLECTYCLTTYPVRDGIPVLLLDEATPGPHGIGELAAGSDPSR